MSVFSFRDHKALLLLALATVVGLSGLRVRPLDPEDPFLGLIATRNPSVYSLLTYGYGALWFSTPLYLGFLLTSVTSIAVGGGRRHRRRQPLPAYPPPEERPEPFLVVGEGHFRRRPGRAPEPKWLTIPERGLYTGLLVLGAVGTGKTSACLYPYVDQFLRWRAHDPERKIGGLVMEVKGDFCHEVSRMLTAADRADDYVEIGMESGLCYNPLHNNLDPYAVAYAIATLLNNLFGKGKEPFWQQAYTDLLRFVILLRRLADGYTTLSDVYRCILDDHRMEEDLIRLKSQLREAPEVITISSIDYHLHCAKGPWGMWLAEENGERAHPYDGKLETFLASRDVSFTVHKATGSAWLDRRHQFEAIERWYYSSWQKLDGRLRSSITEGLVVFLASFDENPALHRVFCPPAAAYIGPLERGALRPLPPIADLLETGKVLALNFPVGLNPGLARTLGVMLKLDFQQAVLQRIPRIAAEPERYWRDVLFVCDEYHAFASTGQMDPSGDERTFALSRQARLITIAATQSISSLRSVLPAEEALKALLQCFRNKIFLTTSDESTALTAAELCGRSHRLQTSYSISETGQSTHTSLLTGGPVSARHSLTASKSYIPQYEYLFPPRIFTELHNYQSVALLYDGRRPQPPQYCYLTPHYLNPAISHFEHVARGDI